MIFVIVDNIQSRIYRGMDEATVLGLISAEGKVGVVVTEKEYEDFVKAHPPTIPDTSERDQAIRDLKNGGKTDSERFDALIKVLGL